MPHGTVNDPHVFIAIDDKGIVSIIAHRAEMGTGSRTSLPMVVADELEADWARVRIVQAAGRRGQIRQPGHGRLAQHAAFHPADARMRRACRQMLEAAAAKRWGVDIGEVAAVNHEVVHKSSGKKLGFGELAAAASALPTPPVDRLRLKDPAAFRYIGKGQVQIIDLFDITVGRAKYGQDIMLPGLKFRRRRPPAGGRRHGRLVRRDEGAGGARRREGGEDRRDAGARQIRAARRRRRHRPQHLVGNAGPRGR